MAPTIRAVGFLIIISVSFIACRQLGDYSGLSSLYKNHHSNNRPVVLLLDKSEKSRNARNSLKHHGYDEQASLESDSPSLFSYLSEVLKLASKKKQHNRPLLDGHQNQDHLYDRDRDYHHSDLNRYSSYNPRYQHQNRYKPKQQNYLHSLLHDDRDDHQDDRHQDYRYRVDRHRQRFDRNHDDRHDNRHDDRNHDSNRHDERDDDKHHDRGDGRHNDKDDVRHHDRDEERHRERYDDRYRYRDEDRYHDRHLDQDRDHRQRDHRVQQKERKIPKSPLVRTLLRISNDINCDAKVECQNECDDSNGQKRDECENECETNFECDDKQEVDECAQSDEDECGDNGNKSTKGELLVTEKPECTRCKK